MAWLTLVLAGLLEIVWAIGIKYTEGWTRLLPSVIVGVSYLLSLVLLSAALKHLPVGTAYAIWVGIGAVGVTVLGIVLFGESAAFPKLFCIGLILAGVIGLRFWGDAGSH